MVTEGFPAAAAGVAHTVGPLQDSDAQEFLGRFPLDAIFRELSNSDVAPSTIEDTCQALGKVFQTLHGASLLSGILPYATAALQSPSAPLRRLAVQQAGRLAAAQATQPCIELLLKALQDPEVGVASEAEAGLTQLASPQAQAAQGQELLPLLLSPQQAGGAALRRLAASADPVLRMRSLTLLVALASQSPRAAAVVQQSGLLEPLLEELQDPDDLLSCMAALQLVRDAAEHCHAGMAVQLQAAVMPRLGALLQHPEPVLQSGALKAGAALLSASLEAGATPTALDGAAAAGNGTASGGAAAEAPAAAAAAAAAAHPLLAALKDVLDVGGSREFPPDLEEAALDAVGILGLQAAGAEAALTDPSALAADVAYKALGRPPSPSQRIAALHALAALAGAERSGRSGKLLSPAAESGLRVAVFEGAAAAWAGATPAEVLQQQLEQPFPEQRVAVYRCLAALAARDWLAAQVCGQPQLLAFLLDPQSESSKQGCEWRYACVAALAATATDVLGGGLGAGGPHQAALESAAGRLQAGARAGPFGSVSTAQPMEHVVATLPGM